jgi:hypothetical protein
LHWWEKNAPLRVAVKHYFDRSRIADGRSAGSGRRIAAGATAVEEVRKLLEAAWKGAKGAADHE